MNSNQYRNLPETSKKTCVKVFTSVLSVEIDGDKVSRVLSLSMVIIISFIIVLSLLQLFKLDLILAWLGVVGALKPSTDHFSLLIPIKIIN